MNRTHRLSVALLAALTHAATLGGCGDDQTGIPQPFPLPKPSRQLLRSTAAAPDLEAEIRVVGLPGAVARAGTVIAALAGGEVQARSTDQGSFTLVLTARAGDVIALRFETSEPVELEVPQLGIMTPRPPHELPGVPPLSGPASGVVVIRGETSPAAPLLAVNEDSGAVATATSDAAGRFELQLAATAGDSLLVYDDADPLLAPWPLVVP